MPVVGSPLDQLLEEFTLGEEYRERIVQHLVDLLYPTKRYLGRNGTLTSRTLGIPYGDYLFGKLLTQLGLDVSAVKEGAKKALLDPAQAERFHRYKRVSEDYPLFLEYIDDPDPDELLKKDSGRYKHIWYSLFQLLFDTEGEPFSRPLRRQLVLYRRQEYVDRIKMYLEDPLVVMYYLFLHEREYVEIRTSNSKRMPNRNPVWAEDLDFYYHSRHLKRMRVIRKPTHGFEQSLNAYLDIREWYDVEQKNSSQIFIPTEFPFEGMGMFRRFYDFEEGILPEEVKAEMDDGRRFLFDKGRLLPTQNNEYHLNIHMSPPAMIIIDFEHDGWGA